MGKTSRHLPASIQQRLVSSRLASHAIARAESTEAKPRSVIHAQA
jgi:hypothetical protein